MRLTECDERRFWEKVALPNGEGCMLWMAYVRPNGYGQFGRCTPAHRVSYELAYGPIPDGLHIDHLCRVRACVRADHLEAVTQAENIRRGNAGAHQRAKTHCPQGHLYDAENTGRGSQGQRKCLICTRLQGRVASAQYRQRQRAA